MSAHRVSFRDDIEDHEANVFATLMLMPDPWFTNMTAEVDWLDEDALKPIARRFDVSIPMLCYRRSLARKQP